MFNAENIIQGVPKVLFLYFKFVMKFDLVNKSFIKQKLSFNLIHSISFLSFHLLTATFSLCTAMKKQGVHEYIFLPHIFFLFIARIAWTSSFFFVKLCQERWNPLALMHRHSAMWEHKHVYVVVQFYPCFKFYFPLFQTHYHTLPYPKTKQNKI